MTILFEDQNAALMEDILFEDDDSAFMEDILFEDDDSAFMEDLNELDDDDEQQQQQQLSSPSVESLSFSSEKVFEDITSKVENILSLGL